MVLTLLTVRIPFQEAYEGLIREKFPSLPSHWVPEVAKQASQAKASSAGVFQGEVRECCGAKYALGRKSDVHVHKHAHRHAHTQDATPTHATQSGGAVLACREKDKMQAAALEWSNHFGRCSPRRWVCSTARVPFNCSHRAHLYCV